MHHERRIHYCTSPLHLSKCWCKPRLVFVYLLQAFYADIYAEAKRAKPSAGHRALAAIAAMGKMQRHYTMNIDGLAESVGLTTWHPDTNPSGERLPLASYCRFPFTAECAGRTASGWHVEQLIPK